MASLNLTPRDSGSYGEMQPENNNGKAMTASNFRKFIIFMNPCFPKADELWLELFKEWIKKVGRASCSEILRAIHKSTINP